MQITSPPSNWGWWIAMVTHCWDGRWKVHRYVGARAAIWGHLWCRASSKHKRGRRRGGLWVAGSWFFISGSLSAYKTKLKVRGTTATAASTSGRVCSRLPGFSRRGSNLQVCSPVFSDQTSELEILGSTVLRMPHHTSCVSIAVFLQNKSNILENITMYI